ncbi:class II glutamine amidotransferase [Marinobacter hydrocarbonoclasticus]|nr:class II glutamine amidotransferase [Marinobacter nauticus]
MCRFILYRGAETLMYPLLYDAENGLVAQSKNAQKRKKPLNADGFGLGWYTGHGDPEPATFVNVDPAWSNRNLAMIASKVPTRHFFAHVRDASVGMPVSQANCHPFSFGRYLFMHNGRLDRFDSFKRALQKELSDEAFGLIEGNTDSEHAFALFMDTIGFKSQCSAAELEQGLLHTIEKIMWLRQRHGADTNAFINFAVSDGEQMLATRFNSDHSVQPASLFMAGGVKLVTEGGFKLQRVRAGETAATLICSEPLTAQKSLWQKVERNHLVRALADGSVEQVALDLPQQADLRRYW